MKVDYYKEHKALLALMKKMGISLITAEEYKSFINRQGGDGAKTFEDVKFENGATPILIERNGNSITLYDSNGKYKYFRSIDRDIVKEIRELISVYKPTTIKFEYNVFYKNGFPIKVTIDAVDAEDANEKLYAKLNSITDEKPQSVELIA